MEEKLKKLFEYLKEIYELKTRVVLDYKKYEAEIGIDEFNELYKDIADIHNFSSDISGTDEYFVLKYISSERQIPKIDDQISNYIEIKDDEIYLKSIDISDDIKYKCEEYIKKYNEIKKINGLIRKYNLLYEMFFELNRRKTDFEEKIEIILAKGLFIYKNDDQSLIRRHIFEVPLSIEINQKSNIIYLKIDSEIKANIEFNFLFGKDFNIRDRALVEKVKADFEEQYLINDKMDFNSLYEEYLNSVSFKFEYSENDLSSIEIGKSYIINKDTIIIRKKQPTIWMDDLNNVVRKINENTFNPENIMPYLILEEDEQKIGQLLNSGEENNSQVLFPLPSNEEQYKVVRQTNNSNLVLVQGPPGTGKSHTIANLISNYVAYGKKILITSEKYKALEVIKEKLPAEIRDLSMTLFTDTQNNNELSNSIQIVLDKYKDKEYLFEYQSKITDLENKLFEIKNLKEINRNNIMKILLNNSYDYKNEVLSLVNVNLNSYRLVDIAKFLNDNNRYNYIKDINDYRNIMFNGEVLLEINPIAKSLNEFKSLIIGRETELSKNIDWEGYRLSIENFNKIEQNNNISNLVQEGIDDKNLKQHDINSLSEKLKDIIELERFYSKNYIIENSTYMPRMSKLQNIIDKCKNAKQFFEQSETELMGNYIEIGQIDRNSLYQSLAKIHDEVLRNGKIGVLKKMMLQKELVDLSNVFVNNIKLDENAPEQSLRLAISKVNYELNVLNVKNDIFTTLGPSELWGIVNESEFSKSIDNLVNILSTFVNYQKNVADLKVALNEIFRANEVVLNYIRNDEFIKINEKVNEAINYLGYLTHKNNYDNKLKDLEVLSAKNQYVFDNIILAMKNMDIEAFNLEKNKIERLYEIDEKYELLKNKYSNETKNYPKFIEKFISLDDDERRNIIDNFYNVLGYYKLNMFLNHHESEDQKFGDLLDQKEELQLQEEDIIVKLIEKKSWYNQINSMNDTICKSLAQWLSLKTKLGKGTGKRANIIRREMQEQMKIAKDAIPIWIMPLDKVIEQYPYSNKPQFDVIIMDESSQSSIISLTALLRGKKTIIVGDDKQISPISVGISVDNLKILQDKYLANTNLGVGFDMDMSIYDLAQNVCGSKKVVLKEHFRCLPEIIEFSGKYFYGNQINCLKVRGKENTIKNPIEIYYLEDGKILVSGTNNILNKYEVDKIVEILKNIENDETYLNKSIGVIVLQNSIAQIKALNNAIWKNFDSDFINSRRIKIGNSYEFQGDERDVIILSMVISKKQEDGESRIVKALTTKEFERSFNVAASRAREQVILVHSISPMELSEECLRHKLITYYNSYENDSKIKSEMRFDTDFEREIYKELIDKNINITSHFKIGKYELDFVVNDEKGKKIAIECDGDSLKTKEEFEDDIIEHDVLARCGWKFIRVRASQYYLDKEKTVLNLVDKINKILE